MPLAMTVSVLAPVSVPGNTSYCVLVGRFPIATPMVLKSWLRVKK